MAAAVPVLMIMAVVGGAIKGWGERNAANAQAAQANINARTAEQAATDSILRGQAAEESARRKGWAFASTQRAAMGATGVDVGAESFTNVLADTAAMTEMEALAARSNAAREAWGFQSEATQFRNQARMAKSAGRYNLYGSLLGGASQAMTTYAASKKT
jgi:hypothetical protein